ncbi:hypothetical protein [Burkholderia cepacia]|uniref:hypothetical protein n=1 Tax=Burkholderia cepacia TaxID=292 RepID=UPI00264ACC84|nr:hypothetical protein [Burkholderia cepacia]MDN7913686.1 hypothetical protein [Burkholderia cepacia]
MPDIQEQKISKPVKVFCKLPNGIQYLLPGDRRVKLNGFYGNERSPLQVSGMPGRDTVFGYGVTLVNADDWEQIVKDHGKSDAHVNKHVFAAKDDRSGEAQSRELEGEKTGFEPYNPSAHPEDKSGDGTASGKPAAE